MNFHFRNIAGHAGSTFYGLVFGLALLALVGARICSLADVSPLLLVVVPFMLYGRRPPGAPGVDSTGGAELAPIGPPGAGI